ncbi:MAG: MoaD/ThiS family protein [Thermoleophilia bacterium]|nr:MoaD/ThiS family protein [Thermoleophilia bacterium]
MATAHMRLPVGVAGSEGPSHMRCEGRTVADALADCVAREPRLRPRVFRDDGSVWAGIFVNGRNVRQGDGLETVLADGDEIRLLPPLGGG